MNWSDNVSDGDISFVKTLLDTIGIDGLKTAMEYHLDELDELEHTQIKIIDEFKYGCDRCGACCRECDPQLTDEDIIRICKYLEMNFDEFYDKYMNKSYIDNYLTLPCPFLDNNNECEIYDVRPDVCRNYPFSDDALTTSPCKLGKLIYDEMVKTYGYARPSDEDIRLLNLYMDARNRLIHSGHANDDPSNDGNWVCVFVSNEMLLGVLKRVHRERHAKKEMNKYE